MKSTRFIILIITLIFYITGCASLSTQNSYRPEDQSAIFQKLKEAIETKNIEKFKDISSPMFIDTASYNGIINILKHPGYTNVAVVQIPEQDGKYGIKEMDGLYGKNYLYYISIKDGDREIERRVAVIEKYRDGHYAVSNMAEVVETNKATDTEQNTVEAVNAKPNTTPSINNSGSPYLYNGTGNVAIAISESIMDEAVDAAISKNYQRFDELVYAGKLLPVKDGTMVDILDTGMARIKIRVSEGTFSGQTGWVQTEFVRVQ